MMRTTLRRSAWAAAALTAVLALAPTATASAAQQPPTADTAAACAFYDGDALTMYGQRGDRVSQIQCMLANRHYLPWKAVDGVFGDRTLAAVERFQRDHPPLAVDGMVGTLTWNALWYA
ncbi:peptidoglycan-binding domain-containing protein [Streptomyces sp. NBC_01465]|uniref:peptidoglycan-binding domain-containing protein n=1 Tax=Streptomyces sp. NBC_01465 TaxID=2903878 RepID=UPI002E328EF1|nr:peptidoglycan-binding protein [Streptomyces sp. NBC_01465]